MNDKSELTNDEYYAEVKRLGLRPSAVPGIYVTSTGDVFPVPSGAKQTPEQRKETLDKLKGLFGIVPSGRLN